MFKCKQCSRQFGANVPAACPACGAVCSREEQGVRRLVVFGFYAVLWEVLLLAVVVAVILAVAAWLAGWF